ncbi:MAG: isoprenyl transferase [Bacteroidales bacterium]
MDYKDQIDLSRVPKHIAIIMDGNGRWAKKKGMPRTFGHQHGIDPVRKITEAAAEVGVKHLTLYTFSTENWNRPIEEVQALMELLVRAIEHETPDLMKKNVRLKAIGDISKLNETSKEKLQECISKTAQNNGIELILALSYSSRSEITKAIQDIAQGICSKEISIDDITEELITSKLMTQGIPDPELMIRTGGEQRISNFLLWQLSYSELYFTEQFWPDFNQKSLYEAIVDYQSRERRFGKTSEQL